MVLDQSNDRIEDKYSTLTTHGDLGCMKGNLAREFCRVFHAVEYHIFMLPCEMDYSTLAYYANLVNSNVCFNEDCLQ